LRHFQTPKHDVVMNIAYIRLTPGEFLWQLLSLRPVYLQTTVDKLKTQTKVLM